MLDHRAPQIKLAVNAAVSHVSESTQTVEAFCRVYAASAVRLGGVVDGKPVHGTPGELSARSRQRLPGHPQLAVQRLEPDCVPPPDPVADDRHDVVGNVHGATGAFSGSGSGVGSGSGCFSGSRT